MEIPFNEVMLAYGRSFFFFVVRLLSVKSLCVKPFSVKSLSVKPLSVKPFSVKPLSVKPYTMATYSLSATKFRENFAELFALVSRRWPLLFDGSLLRSSSLRCSPDLEHGYTQKAHVCLCPLRSL